MWPETGDGTIELHLRPVSRVMHCQRCGARCREIHEPLQQHFMGGRPGLAESGRGQQAEHQRGSQAGDTRPAQGAGVTQSDGHGEGQPVGNGTRNLTRAV